MKSLSISRIFFGVLLVLLGIAFLFDQFGVVAFGRVFGTWWPILLIVLGGTVLVRHPQRIFPGMFLIILGTLLQVAQLGLLPFSVWNLWPLIFIVLGISVLVRPQRSWEEWWMRQSSTKQTDSQGHINDNVMFASITRRINGEIFAGGKVAVMFGELKLDLRDAQVNSDITLHTDVMFGNIQILVPKGVQVRNNVDLFAGESTTDVVASGDRLYTLTLTGSAMFGGVKVI